MLINLFAIAAVSASLLAVQPQPLRPTLPSPAILEKITFDVSRFSVSSSGEQSESYRSLAYEFCIPATEAHVAEVQAIDATIQYFPHSRGRIGCGDQQYLCIADAHSPDWQRILFAIASLSYVEQIDQFHGE